MPARTVEPRNSHTVTFFQVRNPGPDGCDDSCSFVAWNEGHHRLDGPIPIYCVQIGVTYSSGKYFYKGLPWPRRWDWNFSHNQRRTEFFDNGCFHRSCV
jgi:hypothetical protein